MPARVVRVSPPQLSEAFEEASAALSGASAAAADALQSEVGDLRREVARLSTSKADADALASTARRLQRRTDACAEQAAAVAQRVEELEQHAAAVPQVRCWCCGAIGLCSIPGHVWPAEGAATRHDRLSPVVSAGVASGAATA
jgi:hypothetical protein